MNIKVDRRVGGIEFKDASIRVQALTAEPAHYNMKNGNVEETKNSDRVETDTYGKRVEMRNGKPFIVGFEVQSLDPTDHSNGQQNIQALLTNYANGATVTPYWNQYQKNPQAATNKIDWLKDRDIEVKVHPALWDQMIPTTDKDGKPLVVTPELIKQHAQEIARLPGQFTEINETADVNTAPKNGVTDWIKNVTPAKATEAAIDWIRQADPKKTIIYNDYQDGAQERRMLDQLQRDNKLPDAIGIQMHMDQGNWPLPRVEETINKLAKYGKPIYITEISVLSGEYGESVSKLNHDKIESVSKDLSTLASDKNLQPDEKSKLEALHRSADSLLKQTFDGNDVNVFARMAAGANELQDPALRARVMKQINDCQSWPSTADGEKRQAEYTENLYKVLHSNPHVQGITYWDMTDKNSWKHAPRGWFREDGTPKPVVARMEKLFDQWRTEKQD